MVTFQICSFVYLNVDYYHQEHCFWGERNDSRLQHIRGGVKVLNFWIVCPQKNAYFWEIKTLKNFVQNPRKHLLRLASDSQNFLVFFHRMIPASLTVPITVSDLWEWLFPFPSHNSLREHTPLQRYFPIVRTYLGSTPTETLRFPDASEFLVAWGQNVPFFWNTPHIDKKAMGEGQGIQPQQDFSW